MKLTVEMHQVLVKINTALIKDDESTLAIAFEGVDLSELLAKACNTSCLSTKIKGDALHS